MRRRHHIIGSEADQERPLAYLRRGRIRRSARRSARPLINALALSLLLVLIWLAFRSIIA